MSGRRFLEFREKPRPEELKDRITEELKKVIDPETGEDVVSMHLVMDLKVEDDGKVSLKFRPSAFLCPLGFVLAFSIRDAIEKIKGVSTVDLKAIDFVYEDKLNEMLEQALNHKTYSPKE